MLKLNKKDGARSAGEIKNWYKDRYQNALVWRNILAVTTLVALGVTLVSVLAVYQLTPLKSVEPFVIQVDSKTGITQVVNPLTAKELTGNEAIANYFIAQYIRARESYDAADIQYNQDVVRLMSEPRKVYGAYLEEAAPESPNSPFNRLGKDGTRTVRIKSITPLDSTTVQVRISVDERTREASAQLQKIVLLAYEYVNLDLNPDQRFINPLGFIVTSYRVDDEVVQ